MQRGLQKDDRSGTKIERGVWNFSLPIPGRKGNYLRKKRQSFSREGIGSRGNKAHSPYPYMRPREGQKRKGGSGREGWRRKGEIY